jgi:photosynthetic reaction center cytochrome c subunit
MFYTSESMRTSLFVFLLLIVSLLTASVSVVSAQDAAPTPVMMDTPGVHLLKGLTVPEFQDEMNFMVVALGVNCGYCHVRGNFASDANPKKDTARRMLEMVNAINHQYFPDYKPAKDESRLGKVTCYTCHQGAATPTTAPGGGLR